MLDMQRDKKKCTVPDSKIHGANMGPPGSCRPQMGPMLAPWTLLSGVLGPLSDRFDVAL